MVYKGVLQMKITDFKQLVCFIGEALGEHCEVVLQNCSKGCIEMIVNGQISGRKVGAPLTDLAKRIIENNDWKKYDYIAGYEGHTLDGKLLRSSTFFIKDDGKLVGMLCINMDTSHYSQLSELILNLGGLTMSGKTVLIGNEQDSKQETFINSIEDSFASIIRSLYGNDTLDNFTQEDRLNIIRCLEEKGIFEIKSAISYIAPKLKCSESSVYRYLSKVRKEKKAAFGEDT
jgi:predicted transcriptional regulator YheO